VEAATVSDARIVGEILDFARRAGDFPPQREMRRRIKARESRIQQAWRQAKELWDAGIRVENPPENRSYAAPTRIVLLSDVHIPYDDQGLVRKVLEWLRTTVAQRVILNGDILDFEGISKFADDHAVPLEDEIARAGVFLDAVVEAAKTNNPHCKFDFTAGNHEDRLQKYVIRNAQKLETLVDKHGDAVVSLPHLLDLRARGIRYRGYKEIIKLPGGLYVEHGDKVSKHSAYTAKNVQTDKGGSVIIGHTHRVGAYFKKDRTGFHRAYEQGCLRDLNPKWVTAESANWQQGFGIIDYYDDEVWWYQQVLVQNGRFLVDGSIW